MKKFLAGFLAGAAVTAAASVSAADSAKPFLTKAAMIFHVNGQTSSAGADQQEVIRYKDRLYVPVRLFSEKMGATVDYRLPEYADQPPQVDMYYEDEANFTVADPSHSLLVGQLQVDFGDSNDRLARKPSIRGAAKLLKPIGEGKEAVLVLKDPNGAVVAESEVIQSNGKNANRFKVGEMRTFTAGIPFVTPVRDYSVEVKIIDAVPWKFYQEGFYAQEDTPLDILLSTDHDLSLPIAKGKSMEVYLTFANKSDHDLLIKSARFELAFPGKSGTDIVKSTAELKDTVLPARGGARRTAITWEADVPPGTYAIRVKDPYRYRYEESGTVKEVDSYSDTRMSFPITVKP
ncbi:hypothetical protein [Cohnella caldifontis]|uniref:hypothetical protein n=1 Tax=Cohnella caldifontis TaxID=3027471 RepID=UPI0023ED7D8B|nr:hypothetical protein [Cohnella sp. YIM B05605]